MEVCQYGKKLKKIKIFSALSILTRVTCTTAHATQQIANPVVRTKSLNLIWICYPRLTVKICRKKIKKNNSRFSRRYVLLTRVTCITTHATQQIANPVVRTKSLNLIWICYQRYNIGKKFLGKNRKNFLWYLITLQTSHREKFVVP